MTDRLLANKWTVLDRLTTLRKLANSFADDCFEDFDRDVFFSMSREVTGQIDLLTQEIQRREGRL